MSWEFPRNATLSIWFNYYFRFKLTTNAEDFSVSGTIGTEIEMGASRKIMRGRLCESMKYTFVYLAFIRRLDVH